MGPAPVSGKPLRAGPFLFESCKYRFYDDGFAVDQLKGNLCPYQIDTSEPCGPVYWVWEDGTMSLADDEIQSDYKAYVARLIVE